MAFCVVGAATSVASLSSVMNRSARMLVKKLMERVIRGAHDCDDRGVRWRIEASLPSLLRDTYYKNYATCVVVTGRWNLRLRIFARIPAPPVPADILKTYGPRAFR